MQSFKLIRLLEIGEIDAQRFRYIHRYIDTTQANKSVVKMKMLRNLFSVILLA